ncbi:hypothetical protein STVIR_1822 [Streptomyces viridochromogenes Tue57]|uniref:Uncharacterized protein n=1 Tax=Streptomyces viridochromogenes Tue57 TaxID=1160705 RepID=L8PP43_STRVR|nr:hypothetical protein STVIR_1822 [Streptomyces viridochromogenes Tue57]
MLVVRRTPLHRVDISNTVRKLGQKISSAHLSVNTCHTSIRSVFLPSRSEARAAPCRMY